jgi:hypothetical protein
MSSYTQDTQESPVVVWNLRCIELWPKWLSGATLILGGPARFRNPDKTLHTEDAIKTDHSC